MIYIFSRYNPQSKNILEQIQQQNIDDVIVIDWYCHNGKKYRPQRGTISPKNYQYLSVSKIPSWAIIIPAYFDVDANQNINEHIEVKEFTTYNEAKDYKKTVIARTDSSPPRKPEDIPKPPPSVVNPLNEATDRLKLFGNELLGGQK